MVTTPCLMLQKPPYSFLFAMQKKKRFGVFFFSLGSPARTVFYALQLLHVGLHVRVPSSLGRTAQPFQFKPQ